VVVGMPGVATCAWHVIRDQEVPLPHLSSECDYFSFL
jgi:hypothetical protein